MTNEALVRIQVVAGETGVPEPTLRAWERRYGIPTPERTTAGYRLYGRREIEQVHQMRALCDSGVAPAEAARRVQKLKKKRATTDFAAAARQGLLDAVAAFDIDALESRIRQTFFLGNPLAIVEGIIEPTLRDIGTRWQRGEITIAQEHFASQRLGLLLQDLLRLMTIEPTAKRVLLASFADDDHELGLYSLAIRLAHWQWKPIVLGARTPADSLSAAVKSTNASAVALSSTIEPTRARAIDLVATYRDACADTPWVVGGSGVASMEKMIRAAGGIVAPPDGVRLRALFDDLRRNAR